MPAIENAIEISGIEVLHSKGFIKLTIRSGDLIKIKGKKVLDVACGRSALCAVIFSS